MPTFQNLGKKKAKTYNSGDSLVVTHLTTNPPVSCLYMAERTGSLALTCLTTNITGKIPVFDLCSNSSRGREGAIWGHHSVLAFKATAKSEGGTAVLAAAKNWIGVAVPLQR